MYLSRMEINTKKREAMQALITPPFIHGAVEQSFKGPRQRNLWRIDWLGEKCFLLVLSCSEPDFTHVVEQFGFTDYSLGWETKSYDTLLQKIEKGGSWKFRLKANPIQSSMTDKNETSGRGKIHAHVTQTQQRDWLMKRSEKCGFSLQEDAYDVVHTQWEKFPKSRKDSMEITLRTAIFEGVLTVTDVELFKETLTNGIGKAKVYGCGLLTVAR